MMQYESFSLHLLFIYLKKKIKLDNLRIYQSVQHDKDTLYIPLQYNLYFI